MTRLRWSPVAMLVAATHLALLAALAAAHQDAVTPPELPVMQVMLVHEAEPVPKTPPAPTPPEPVPVELPPLPPPPAPPASEAAISEPPPAPAAPSPPPAPPAPPVIPPQVNAAYGDAPPIRYPAMSRRLGETGTVLLHLHVLADGRVGAAKVLRSSGFARLDNAAVEAAVKWRLTPARRGDEPVAFWYQWPVIFELQ